MKANYIKEAKALTKIGVSVVPVKKDGSKLPKIYWKEFQDRIMSDQEIENHFEECGGVVALTGNISRLICIDFDLDKQRDTDDYWKSFMEQVPKELKKKMLINQTRSEGFHVWLRTDYEDKSRKITLRPLTIPEITERYEKMIADGITEEKASSSLLKNPVECVIETRSKGSYAVFLHEQYKRFFGRKFQEFTKEEVEQLLEIAYSLSWDYTKPAVYKGDIKSYKVLRQFAEDTSPEDVLSFVEETGLFKYYDKDSNGNYRLSRLGSSSLFSAYIYGDTGVMHIFGLNPLTKDDKNTLSPFEVYCLSKGFTEKEAIVELKKQQDEER